MLAHRDASYVLAIVPVKLGRRFGPRAADGGRTGRVYLRR
jgi:hypothetical protein